MKNALVSILMPVQNTAKYLSACLDSIRQQTYVHWELIAVDDHSTDQSRSILKEYAKMDQRIKVLSSDDHGVIPAITVALRHAQGNYVTRMDSDDIMHPDKIHRLLSALDKEGDKTISAGSVQYFSDEGELGDGFKRYAAWINNIAAKGLYRKELYKECVIPSACWMMKRDALNEIGGFADAVYPEDYHLCFQLFQNGFRVKGITAPLHLWRDRPDRASRTKPEYQDNRFFELKVSYFLKLDYKPNRDLVIWGAGKNGKDLAQRFQQQKVPFIWLSDNPNKVGKEIYGVQIQTLNDIDASNSQIIVAVANEEEQNDIRTQLQELNLEFAQDFWFFL